MPDRVFNLISEPRYQVNALLSNLGNEEVVNNYMTLVGISFGRVRIAVEARGNGKLGVYTNDVDVTPYLLPGKPMALRKGGQGVVLMRSQIKGEQPGDRLTVMLPELRITLDSAVEQDYLDVGVAVVKSNTPVIDMHGLIGQTWQHGRPKSLPSVGGTHVVLGHTEDYIVEDGLFGAHFAFNMFESPEAGDASGAGSADAAKVARRMLVQSERTLLIAAGQDNMKAVHSGEQFLGKAEFGVSVTGSLS